MSETKPLWYVIHTYSGYENKVKANLENRIKNLGMEDKIFRVLVPTEESTEIKDGKKKVTLRKIFPSYVLVEMTMSDDSWYVVRNTPGVTSFVGSGNKPIPLGDEEAYKILRMMGIIDPSRPKVNYSVGESLKVILGPSMMYTGVVQEIMHDRSKLRVLVSMFGRDTLVELDMNQAEKL
jgi:transcriptional antiterminator NusG